MYACSVGGTSPSGEGTAGSGVQTGSGGQLIPLTAAQRGMWFAENLSPGYSVTVAHFLDIHDADRPLNRELFVRAVTEAARSLESAFTRIVVVDDVPMQWADPDDDFVVEHIDLRTDPDPVAAARAWMDADHRRSMDLTRDPLATSALIRVADGRSFWYLRGHHIAFDGYAALNSLHEAVHRYNALLAGTRYEAPPRATLAELTTDDEKYAHSTRREIDADHWRGRVADLPEGPSLARHPAAAPLSPDNVRASARLSAERHHALERVAAASNSSSAAVLIAAFAAYLWRMTGVDDVVLSLPVTGRATVRTKRASGMVSNMLPVRVSGLSRRTGRELLAAVALELTGALRHQRYRYEDIRSAAGLHDATAASFGPIVNLVFFDRPIEITGARTDYHILTSGILDDLRINLYQAGPGERLVVDLHGNPNLYGHAEVHDHLERFLTLTDRLLADPDAPVSELSPLFDGEREALLEQGRGPRRAHARADEHLLAGFERQVAATPEAIAVECEGTRLTYREFSSARADLAEHIRSAGVAEGDRVVVALDRGIDHVTAVYAVLTLGAVYVPVDPADPPARRTAITSVVAPALQIDSEFLRRIGFDATATQPATPSASVIPASPTRPMPGTAAYIIFTSGSTGVPKGVEVDHRAVINRLDWMHHDHPIDADDVVLHKTPATFDVSVWELFWPLRTGARMVIAKPGGHRDPDHLHDLIERTGVSVTHFVPSMLDVYADVVAAHGRATLLPDRVRLVFTSGEALGVATATRLLDSSSAQLINLYGPTEAAVDVTAHRVMRGSDAVPIGRPVADTDTYVLDAGLRPVPAGVAGELYIGGRQLAVGYVGAPDRTAERFVANPFDDPGFRMYRTGDLVRWNDIGQIEYLGRTDQQVKIRGRRVELGEIETVLSEVSGAEAVAVVARDDLGPAMTVVGYIRGDTDALDPDAISERCRRRLPPHMVPIAVVVLPEFPVTASGKLDRGALPAPVLGTGVRYEPPVSSVETAVTDLIAALLSVDRVGLRDNVFALGGDSLTAARLVSAARTEHGVTLRLSDVFDSPTIGELAARAVPVTDVETHPAPVRPALIPLSHAQTRLWFINRLDPAAPTYNMSGAVRIGPDVDVDALVLAVRDVVERHATLRTVFPSVDGEPVQRILEMADVAPGLEATVRGDANPDGRSADDVMASAVGTGFDLEHEIGFRCHLLPPVLTAGLDDDDRGRVVVLVVHHIAADGHSLPILIGDLRHAYERRRGGRQPEFAPLAVEFADVALRARDLLGSPGAPSQFLVEGLRFWRDELSGAPDLLTLPTDRPRPQVADGRGDHVDVALPEALTARIGAFANRSAVTPFAVLHSAVAIVLSRLAGTDDVSIGSAVAGRDDPDTADMVGMFVTTVVLRTVLHPAQPVCDLVAASHRTIARAMDHAAVPFERVVDVLAPQRSSSHAPLFQVALTMQADPFGALGEWRDCVLTDARVPAAKYDLTITVTEPAGTGPRSAKAAHDGYRIEINYATALFDAQTVEGIGVHLRTVLEAMVAAPTAPVGRIGLVPVDRSAASTSARTPATPSTLRDLLAAGVDSADERAQAISGAVNLTWSAFETQTNQLARELIDRGVGPDRIVAISMDRSHLSVIAVVAVAKTGAALVTIDTRQPQARRAALLDDSTADLGITTSDQVTPADVEVVASGLDAGPAMDWLVLDDPAFELRLAGHSDAPIGESELIRPVHVTDLAYLLFTSGSTGRPKATAVTHAGLADLVATQAAVLRCDDTSARVLHVASPSFDVSLFEMIMALCAGAELVISPPDVFAGEPLETLIATHGVTHAVMTPSALATLDPDDVATLRIVAGAGEDFPAEAVARWDRDGRELFNLYGPSEATITATAAGPMRAGTPVTIGRPIAGMAAMVLDDWLRPVPDGVSGELYLAGRALGRGYHARPGLTAARFIANPFGTSPDHRRMYRTGDRVVRTADGDLVYLGRNDFQVKIRGVRIEPGEIDGVLSSYPGVDRALTVVAPTPSGDTALVAYLTFADGASGVPQHVLDHAARHLPAHLVPRVIAVLDEFPLTTVGKIDRSALPTVTVATAPESVAPRGQMETVVAGVFEQVLGHPRLGVHENFFALGGNSLSATKVASRVEAILGRRISVRTLLDNPTVATLVGAISTAETAGATTPPLTVRPRSEVVPISTVQRSMWLVNRADPTSSAFNVALSLRMIGDLDVDALRGAVDRLVARRETLRTVYPLVGDEPAQVIRPAAEALADFVVPVIDLAEHLGSDDPVPAAVASVADLGFDLTTELPVRAAVLRLGPGEHVLVFVVHHISADGASLVPLARDLVEGYTTPHRVEASRLPLVQYADWAVWQRDRLSRPGADGVSEAQRQLDHWTTRLAGAPARFDLPTDRPRTATPTSRGDVVDFEIPADVAERLEIVAREQNTTLFMIVHAALAALLSRLTGRDDIVIGTPYVGRDDACLDDMVGMFVNTLALRTHVRAGETFDSLLRRVCAEDLADMSHADVGFDEVVTRAVRAPSGNHSPLFGVMLAFQNIEIPTIDIDGLTVIPEPPHSVAAKVDLEIVLFPADHGPDHPRGPMRGRVIYATELYDASTVHRIVGRYLRVLDAVAADPTRIVGDLAIDVPDDMRSASVGDDTLIEAGFERDLLSRWIAEVASADPETPVTIGGCALTFGEIDSMTAALGGALSDDDPLAAVTMALMTLVPEIADGGAGALDVALEQVRLAVMGAVGVVAAPETVDRA